METENSRRPFVRSREPDLKKPRLSQDPILAVDRSSNGRPSFMQRPATSGSAPSRRVSDRGGDSYPHVQQHQHQHHLELVNEYKTALAELTFNSKPIITNLTIIAGENLDAAKAIAATICSNIIEVPSEQKLPSLYLLDSIVKNIGRDYIKYFGSKLPEVFCKAYRQVDPLVHTSMKHLFGTWKGVFPPQPLQAIEKALGFSAAVNQLPIGASRVDVPVSRPAHSIHVNPKYLEARQRLQESSKAKAASSEPSENVVSSTIDLGGHERTSLGSERPWADSSTKQNSQYTQRELNNVSTTKNISAPVGESEYDSDINQSGFEITQGREKFPGNGRGTVLSTQRNGFDPKNGLPTYHLNSKRALNHGLTDQSTIQTADHWKDSEEEEYMWDDINSRAGDRDDAANSVRDRWSLDDSEKMSEASIDYLSTEMKDQAVFGNRALSSWSQESHLPERLGSVAGRTIPGLSESHPIYSTNGRTSFQSKVALGSIGSSGYGTSNSHTLGSTVSVVPQRQTLGRSSPSAQSLLYYPPGFSSFTGRGVHHSNTDQEMPHSRIALESKTDTDLCTKLGQEALPLPSPDSKRMMSPNAPSSFSVTPNSRQHELESENLVSDLTLEVPKQFSHTLTQHVTDANMPFSSLLSSLVAKGLISAAKTKSTTSNNTSQNFGLETTRSAAKTKSTSNNTSQNLGLETTRSAAKTKSTTSNNTSQNLGLETTRSAAKIKSTTSNTSQNLGLETSRSSAKTKSTTSDTSQNLDLETRSGSSKVSVPIASLPKSSSSITSELSSDKPVSASTSLIGFHFKGDVLRVLHPSVINSLFDDFQHKCGVCEARLKIQDQVGRHLEWHNLRNQKNNSKKASRVWYAADSVNTLLDESSGPQDCTEPVVPADESQCLCILCGELFEDYYDQGIAQWMFKGAVYATVSCSNIIGGYVNEVVEQGSIVHEKCINKA